MTVALPFLLHNIADMSMTPRSSVDIATWDWVNWARTQNRPFVDINLDS